MFITVVVSLCHFIAIVPTPICVEEIVTDSDMDAALTMNSCVHGGQIGIADWKEHNPKYHTWTVEKLKCVPGHYSIPKKA